jgi:hypothetical protein
MSSPIVIPFNFQPVETSVKTANYTIPVGRYARASFSFSSIPQTNASNANLTIPTASFGVNGVVLGRGVSTGRLVISNNSTLRTVAAPSSGSTRMYFNILSGAQSTVNIEGEGNNSFGTSTTFQNYLSQNGAIEIFHRSTTVMTITNSSSNFSHYNFIYYPELKLVQDFLWLRAGDIINLTNASAFVEEYNQIS